MSICDFCFNPDKNCEHNCKGIDCANYSRCHRKLHEVIRITKKCTQSCGHCCFSCSPNETVMMTVQTSKEINQFNQFNHILMINIMGGEFWCNPDYYKIICNLSQGMRRIRITTNGDWVIKPAICKKLLKIAELLKSLPEFYLGISKDQYHNNKNVEKAVEFCQIHEIPYIINDADIQEAIVPVGKGAWHETFMSSISCCCKTNKYLYSFMVDERGVIFYCSYGIWGVDLVQNYLTESFGQRFIEVKKIFNSALHSCVDCYRSYLRLKDQFDAIPIIQLE